MNRENKLALYKARQRAKLGLSISLGVLVATGFLAGRNCQEANKYRNIHISSGLALVGLSYWHWSLYKKRPK